MGQPGFVAKAPPKVLPCKCGKPHEFQDATCGKGRRLANPTAKAANTKVTTYRCTVCGDSLDG